METIKSHKSEGTFSVCELVTGYLLSIYKQGGGHSFPEAAIHSFLRINCNLYGAGLID